MSERDTNAKNYDPAFRLGFPLPITELDSTGAIAGQVPEFDGLLVSWETVGSGSGIVQTIVAGDRITVDSTDPANPIVTADVQLPLFTEGAVPFADPAGELTEDPELFWDNTNKELRIGDPTVYGGFPNDPLAIEGSINDYYELTIRNRNSGNAATAEMIFSNDIDDGDYFTGTYLDIGIVSSTWDQDQLPPNTSFVVSHGGGLYFQVMSELDRMSFAIGEDTVENEKMYILDTGVNVNAKKDVEQAPALEAIDWTATGGWSAGSAELTLVSDPGTSTIEPSAASWVTAGVTYRVIITASAVTGTVTYTLGGVSGTAITATTITDYITADTTGKLIITGDPTATATITSISVRALIPNTGDMFIEGELILGSGISTISDIPVVNISGSGVASFPQFLELPNAYPTDPLQATNKAYVDFIVSSGARFVGNVLVATTTALPANTYNNGALGVGATLTANANGALPAIDGVTLINGDILLVKDEAAQETNGAYEVTDVGSGGTPFILTRITAYDEAAEIVTGTFFTVLDGTVNTLKQFSMITDSAIVVGTTAIEFAQLSAPISYTASNGVQLVGNDFSSKRSASGAITLVGGGSDEMAVNVDNSTIEISTNALQIKDAGVTLAKIQNITSSRILGRTTASPGVIEELTVGTGLELGSGSLTSAVQQYVTTSNFTKTSDTALANVTGLSATIVSGQTYLFEATLYTTSINTAGVKASISGTATATSIIYEGWATNTTPAAKTRATALNTTVGALTAATVATIRITGRIVCNAGGTLTVQFAQNVSQATGSVVLPGSSLVVSKV